MKKPDTNSVTPLPDPFFEEPKGVYERVGKHSWHVYISLGFFRYGANDGYGWTRYSEKSAKRKAALELKRYRRKNSWSAKKGVVA